MLIFGIRTKSKPVGHVLYHCSHCHANRVHTALSISKYFTLFFIAILPLGREYQIACNLCGLRLKAVALLEQQLRQMDLTGALPERV